MRFKIFSLLLLVLLVGGVSNLLAQPTETADSQRVSRVQNAHQEKTTAPSEWRFSVVC